MPYRRVLKKLLHLWFVGGYLSCIAFADDLYVWQSSPYPGPPYNAWTNAALLIQDAVDAAQPGDTVWVTNGVYNTGGRMPTGSALTNRVVLTNAVTVLSVNGPEYTVVEGNPIWGSRAVRCAYLSAGMLSGFTLTNGHTQNSAGSTRDDVGGGALMTGGVISNCVIVGNAARTSGGGLAGGEVVNSKICFNEAFLGNGGGLYETKARSCEVFGNWTTYWHGGGAATSVLVDCTISNNISPYFGGGMYESSASNSVLSGNLAKEGGGAFGGNFTKCTFSGNQSSNYGGGADNAWLTDCRILNNTATNGGGAAFSTLIDCTVSGNTARTGGGVYGADDVSNCLVTANYADEDGGGLYAPGTVVDSSISFNHAGDDGGGTRGGTLINCHIVSNTAGMYGGGTCYASPESCVIEGNTGHSGGGTYAGTINGCLITNNVASYGGGANYSFLYSCTVTANRAEFDGGGAANCNAHRNSYFLHNIAGRDGGGVARPLWTDVQNCIIVGNVASNAGGGAFFGYQTFRNCTIISNTAASGGGVYSNFVTSCIIYQNTALDGADNFYAGAISNSCTFPLAPGDNNITNAPLFTDRGEGGYYPLYGPVVDSVDSVEASSASDFLGTARPLDGNIDGTNAYDMGAIEYDPTLINSDSDPVLDFSEFVADTDPLDGSSYFRIISLDIDISAQVEITCTNSRFYSLQVATNLIDEAAWQYIAGQTNIPGGVSGVMQMEDSSLPSSCNYRVVVRKP